MIENNNQFYKIRSVFTVVGLSLLTACSYAPGLRVSGVLNQKSQQGIVVGGYPLNDSKNHADRQNTTKDVTESNNNSTEEIPTYFTTDSGVNIEFQNLNHKNVPQIPKVTDKELRTIRYLLRHDKLTDYKISTGDSISISLWAYPEIFAGGNSTASTFTVSQTGYISLPLIGRIKAKGKTQDQLRNEISHRYSRYLKQPDVDLKITRFNGRFYSIQGQVKKTGEFVIDDRPATLMTALSEAGGLLETADAHHITLTRMGKNYQFGLPELRAMGIASSNIFLRNGDSIYVDSNANRKVYLIGEVGKSTYLTIPEDGLSLANALGESQGLNSRTANPAKIYIVRKQKNQNLTHIYRLDLSQLENLALANDFQMLANDMVYVDPTGLTRWNRILTQILSSANAIRTGQAIGNN